MSALHRALLVFGIGALIYGSALLTTTTEDARQEAHQARLGG